MNPRALLHPVSLFVLLCALLPAQDTAAIRGSFGASRTDGGAWAGGPDYSVRFDRRGPAFVPRHAAASASSHAVHFRLESARRGSAVFFARTADVEPAVAGNRVSYAHGGDLTEVYEARREGIEQSFVFARRPSGHGDLVVRGAIATGLPLVAATDAGVRYELPGVAGVTFGAVTGVDANGATARGAIRVDADGAHVEWVLPAAFVESAAYPLVLDPLIGSVVTIGDASNGADLAPNVAFDDATNRYLVVWNDTLNGTNAEMRGQFVSTGGTLVGSAFFIGWGHLTRQSLANVKGTGRFVVTAETHYWSGITSSVRVRSIDAGTGAVSNSLDVELGWSGGNVSVRGPVVGGDSRSGAAADTAMVVYERNGAIVTCVVHVPATGDPFVAPGAYNTIAASGSFPSITAHGGSAPRWLVTWETTTGGEQVWTGMVGSSGTLCGSPKLLYTAAANDNVIGPVCAAADAATFFVAWQDTNGGQDDVFGKVVTWSGGCGAGSLTAGPLLSPITTPGRRHAPALAFAKDKFLLAWKCTPSPGAATRVYVKGLDPVHCASCGAEWAVETTSLDLYAPSVASRFSAGDTASDEALVVWSNDAVRARRFEARGNDVVTGMGGGCVTGLNDFASYNGDAVLGNADFQLVIANPVSLPLVLIVGFSAVSAPCGNCTIVPSPDILFPATNPYALAIPCDPLLVGQDLYTQWLVLKPSTCPILPDFSFTNALKFTIGE